MVLMIFVNINDFLTTYNLQINFKQEKCEIDDNLNEKRRFFNLYCDYHYLVAFSSQLKDFMFTFSIGGLWVSPFRLAS